MARRIGAQFGPGTSVEEVAAQNQIQRQTLGVAAFAGTARKGAANDLIVMRSEADVYRYIGRPRAGEFGVQAAVDYFVAAQGAPGAVLFTRVTDGNEVPSLLRLMTREDACREVGIIRAASGGRWGGQEAFAFGEATVASAVTALTIDTGVTTWTEDQWKGATLTFDEVSNRQYTVVGNTAAGVLSVASDQNLASELTGHADANWRLELEFSADNVSVRILDGDLNPRTEFRVEVYENGSLIPEAVWPNLSIDPDSDNYWVTQINERVGNVWIVAEDTFAGGEPIAAARPSNGYGFYESHSGSTLTVRTFNVDYGNLLDEAEGVITMPDTTDDNIAQILTLTATGASSYTVTSSVFGAVGNGNQSGFVSQIPWVPSFTMDNLPGETISDFTAGETLTIRYKPLEAGRLAGGDLFPDKDQSPSQSLRIESNTHNTVSVSQSINLDDFINIVQEAEATATITFPAQADLAAGNTDYFTLTSSNGTSRTWFFDVAGNSTAGAGVPAGAVAVDVSGDTSASDVAGAFEGPLGFPALGFTVTRAGAVVTVEQPTVGPAGNIETSENVASANFELTDFTGGTLASTNTYQVSYLQSLGGGRDGEANVGDAEYMAAWDPRDALFNRARGRGFGVLEMATPGVSSSLVERAGANYGNARSHIYNSQAPSDVLSSQQALDHYEQNIGRNDHLSVDVTGYVYIVDPESASGRLKQTSVIGMKLGEASRIANATGGYAKPPAGVQSPLQQVVRPVKELSNFSTEVLTPRGLNVIAFRNGNYVPWGNRMFALNNTWSFKNQRKQMSYYANILIESFDLELFDINDPGLWDSLYSRLDEFFSDELENSQLDRALGRNEAYQIKIDEDNNPDESRELGDLNVSLLVKLANAVERINFSLDKDGVVTTSA